MATADVLVVTEPAQPCEGGEGTSGEATWTDTRLCGVCQTLGSYFILRRSHCRVCGRTMCPSCNAGTVPSEWLDVPYMRLCRGIPQTHAHVMRCCIHCAEETRLSEADYLWHRVLDRQLADDTYKAKWRPESLRAAGVVAYLDRAADALREEYEHAVASPLPEFACTNFGHSAACHRAVSHDGKLHMFDVVYTTPKLLAAPAAELAALQLDVPTIATLLSRPITCDAVFDRIRKYAPGDDAFPSLYHLTAHENRARFLSAATQQQRTCLHMHLPSDDMLRKTLPAGVLADVAAHRACLSSFARAADAGIAAGGTVGALAQLRDIIAEQPHILFKGEPYRVCGATYISPSVLAVAAESDANGTPCRLRVLFGAQACVVDALAFVNWEVFARAFVGMTVLDDGCAAVVISVPVAPGVPGASPAVAGPGAKGTTANAASATAPIAKGTGANAVTAKGTSASTDSSNAAGANVAGSNAASSKGLSYTPSAAQGARSATALGAVSTTYSPASASSATHAPVFAANPSAGAETHAVDALYDAEAPCEELAVAAMWGTLRSACPRSLIFQCAALTILQVTSGRLVDRSKLRFMLDEDQRILVYSVFLLPLGDAGTDCPGPWTRWSLHPDAAARVRTFCARIFRANREYTYFVSALLRCGDASRYAARDGVRRAEHRGLDEPSDNAARLEALPELAPESTLVFTF